MTIVARYKASDKNLTIAGELVEENLVQFRIKSTGEIDTSELVEGASATRITADKKLYLEGEIIEAGEI